jgi:tetratricopeptide (TPR) repeat protein
MIPERRKTARAASLALVLLVSLPAHAQAAAEDTGPVEPAIQSLELAPDTAHRLQDAMFAHDYIMAEKLLLAEINRDPHSPRGARLLTFAGTVYFRNQDFVNAAIAWKKSEAIAPLDSDIQFSLAMAYVRMGRAAWARPILESLARKNHNEALYPYWLGRLDYDGHEYNQAIHHFQHAIEINPRMARAYDNLGLCYYYQNENDLAVTNYEKAIELERGSDHPSPWPFLNLAITQQFVNRLPDAEKNLREAIRLDPGFAKAHFQLGTVLEDRGQLEDALGEMRQAAQLDVTYPEPHMAMARILHKMGRESEAKSEVQIYLRLRPPSMPKP